MSSSGGGIEILVRARPARRPPTGRPGPVSAAERRYSSLDPHVTMHEVSRYWPLRADRQPLAVLPVGDPQKVDRWPRLMLPALPRRTTQDPVLRPQTRSFVEDRAPPELAAVCHVEPCIRTGQCILSC